MVCSALTCACLTCFQIGDPAVYLDYLRIAVGGELTMGVGLEYDVSREYHHNTQDFVIGDIKQFQPLTFQAGKPQFLFKDRSCRAADIFPVTWKGKKLAEQDSMFQYLRRVTLGCEHLSDCIYL